MAALFPRWVNTLFGLLLGLVLLSALALLATLWVYVRTPWNTGQYSPVKQPAQFDPTSDAARTWP